MIQKQIQELKTKVRMQSTYGKAQVIAVSKRIRKASLGKMWMVESSKGGFYKVEYVSGEMVCECPAFVYGMTVPCKHIISVAVKETS
jgi:predicted nucleic acid-binding Zn finger protein